MLEGFTGHQCLAQPRHFLRLVCLIQRGLQRFHRGILLKMVLPSGRGFRICQVRFAQDFDAGLGLRQRRNHWVLTTRGQTRVQQFNHKVNLWQDFSHLAGGFVHMSRIPMNRHIERPLSSVNVVQAIDCDALR